MNLGLSFIKDNSKWIIDLSVKCKTVKFPEDNIVDNLDDFGYSDNFLEKNKGTIHERNN